MKVGHNHSRYGFRQYTHVGGRSVLIATHTIVSAVTVVQPPQPQPPPEELPLDESPLEESPLEESSPDESPSHSPQARERPPPGSRDRAIPEVLIFTAGCVLAKRIHITFEDAAPSAMIGASNHFEVAIATATILFGLFSGTALATVVGVLIEVPTMILLVKICLITRGWFTT